ncbi:MAG: NUDIX hydrolase [Candidatus Saccharibacteria bacterium]|nr:NUDIX hydrolase [Candidatus Saccharibacteria bacterium]
MKTEHQVIISCVILNEQGQVLLGKRSMDEDVFPGLWGIPGGKVETTITGPDTFEENLKRETLEEMGIAVEIIGYLDSSARVSDDKSKIYIIFLAKITSGEPKPLEDTVEVKWWNVADLEESILTPKTLESIQKGVKYQA